MTILLASINIYTTCLPGIQRSPNRVSQFWEPKLQSIVSCHVVLGIDSGSPGRAKSALELRSHLFSLTNQISYFILRLNKQPLISNAFSHFIFPHQTYSLELNQTVGSWQSFLSPWVQQLPGVSSIGSFPPWILQLPVCLSCPREQCMKLSYFGFLVLLWSIACCGK